MPRYRKLYTNTIDSLDVDAMPDDFHRLTWVLLPLILCRDGRGMYYPTWLRSKLYPLRSDVTDSMIANVFAWYEQRGMIATYEVDGRRYFYIPTWSKFQGITTKESESPYPPPPDNGKSSARVTPELVQSNARVGLPLVNTESESEYESESESDTPFRKLLDAFIEATGIQETMLNLQKAAQEISDKWIPGNVTPEEVKAAAKQLIDKQYSITGPWSLTNSINMLRSSKKKGGARPGSEYKLPEGYDDEVVHDDTPEVDMKWQTFVQQHVKDRRWQNLLEYGGMTDDGVTVIHVPETVMDEAQSRFGSTIDRFFMGKAQLEGVPA